MSMLVTPSKEPPVFKALQRFFRNGMSKVSPLKWTRVSKPSRNWKKASRTAGSSPRLSANHWISFQRALENLLQPMRYREELSQE